MQTLHIDPPVTIRDDLEAFEPPHPLPRSRVLRFDGAMRPDRAPGRRCPFPAAPVAIADDPVAENARRAVAKAEALQARDLQDQRDQATRTRHAKALRAAQLSGLQTGYVKGWHQGLRDGLLPGCLIGAGLVTAALHLGRWVGAL